LSVVCNFIDCDKKNREGETIPFFFSVAWRVSTKKVKSQEFFFTPITFPLSCITTKIATSNDRHGITSKKLGTVLLMQNVDDVPIG
jgi:hypothetical protein